MLNTARVNVFETPSLFHQVDATKAQLTEVALLIQGRVRRLPEGVWLKIGSDRRAPLHIDDPHISSKHAVIRRQGNTVEVLDSQSTNGLWWRGERHEELTLDCDDVFFLGALPALIVQVGFSARFPKAYRWCDMVLMPSSSVLLERIALMASTNDPVMILGESGTGKERVARSIHATSSRAEGSFVALNCAALPENLAEGELFGVHRGAFTGADRSRSGLFERASGGTLFLDEVGELSPAIQAKLLRVLETQMVQPLGSTTSRKVDVRIITATWRELRDSNHFRYDLYQRLHVLPIQLRPLRTRSEEIGPLLELFLSERKALHHWPMSTILNKITSAPWHGNIRELRNRVIRCACTGNIDDLVPEDAVGYDLRTPRRGSITTHLTEDKIRRTLATHRGNRSAAAKDLGISRSTLYRRLQRSG